MKDIIDAMGESLAEFIGAAAVILGLSGALIVFRAFGDVFIELFL